MYPLCLNYDLVGVHFYNRAADAGMDVGTQSLFGNASNQCAFLDGITQFNHRLSRSTTC